MIDYSAYADTYDDRYRNEMSRKETETVKRILKSRYSKNKKVLDIGCGTGFALDICDIDRNKYAGIDISAKMIDRAEKKHPGYSFFITNAENFSVSTSFDVTLCLFSIPYVGANIGQTLFHALNTGGEAICVFYKKPYKNPDSVYYGHKWKYIFTVKPKVRKAMRGIRKALDVVFEIPLTDDETYTVGVYKKAK